MGIPEFQIFSSELAQDPNTKISNKNKTLIDDGKKVLVLIIGILLIFKILRQKKRALIQGT